MHLFLAVLGLRCCMGFSLVEASRLLIAVASLVPILTVKLADRFFTAEPPGKSPRPHFKWADFWETQSLQTKDVWSCGWEREISLVILSHIKT